MFVTTLCSYDFGQNGKLFSLLRTYRVTRTFLAACGVSLGAHSEGLHNDEPGSRAPFLVGQELKNDLVR